MQHLAKNAALGWLVIVLAFLPGAARAATLKVSCGQKVAFPTINSALKALSTLSPQGPNTLVVSGACHENVVIRGFGRLTLKAAPGASISDASGGAAPVVYVDGSTEVTFKGFTINGGANGVLCGNFSICRFDGNTVQGAAGAGVQAYQSRVNFDANTIQNNGLGVVSLDSSSVRSSGGLVIQHNLLSLA